MPFASYGVPVAHLIMSNTFHHASGDTPETLSAPGLTRSARACAWFIDRTMEKSREKLERGAIGAGRRSWDRPPATP